MPKSIEIEPHLSRGELEKRFRKARDAGERSQYEIIWLICRGTLQVMEVICCHWRRVPTEWRIHPTGPGITSGPT